MPPPPGNTALLIIFFCIWLIFHIRDYTAWAATYQLRWYTVDFNRQLFYKRVERIVTLEITSKTCLMLTDRPQWPSPFPPAAKFWAQHQPWAISPPSFSWWRWPEDLEVGSHNLQIWTASGQHLGWLITRCCNIHIIYMYVYTRLHVHNYVQTK